MSVCVYVIVYDNTCIKTYVVKVVINRTFYRPTES